MRQEELPYGAEKPITLTEAFVRKYLTVKKNSICMQMRRLKEESVNIKTNTDMFKPNLDSKQDSNKYEMVTYTWS